MKKIYEAPVMKFVKLDTEDVITASNGDTLVDIGAFFGEEGKWGNIF